VSGRSPRFYRTRRSAAPLAMPGRAKRETRAFANYLSIGDRYSAHANFDSENTIDGQFRVNRAHKRSRSFLPTVIHRQQWQKGDSLLNFKFGRCSGTVRLLAGNPPAIDEGGADAGGSVLTCEMRWLTGRCGSVKDTAMLTERFELRLTGSAS
jgi:hypothetical protein